jgi:hypothetical protein
MALVTYNQKLRTPEKFGQEDLKTKVMFFDDFLYPTVTENAWTEVSTPLTDPQNKGVQRIPGGVYSLGNVGGTIGKATTSFTANTFDIAGADLAFRFAFKASSGSVDRNKTGFFLGLCTNGPPTSTFLATGAFETNAGIPLFGDAVGVVRDVTTASSTDGRILDIVHAKRDFSGTTVSRVPIYNLPSVTLPFEQNRFFEIGMTFGENSRSLNVTFDGQVVGAMKTTFNSNKASVALSSMPCKDGRGEFWIGSALNVDWVYMSHDRGDTL